MRPSVEHEEAVGRLKQAGAIIGGFSAWWISMTHTPCRVRPDAWSWDQETETLTVFEVTKTSGIERKLPEYTRMWWVADDCSFELRLVEASAFGEGFVEIDLQGSAYARLPWPVANIKGTA